MNFLITLLLTVNFSQAQMAYETVSENETFEIQAENVLFAGHSTQFWDASRKTETATRELLRAAQQNPAWTSIATAASHMLADPQLLPWHFFIGEPIDYLVHSRAGQHDLQFPNLRHVIFVGGNLGRCLCESIRDVMRGAGNWGSVKREIHFYLVKDGIYDNYPPFAPMKREVVSDFTKNFFVPSLKCPLQNWEIKPRLVLSDWSLKLYYDGESVETFDLEPRDDRELGEHQNVLHLHFIDSSKAKEIISKI